MWPVPFLVEGILIGVLVSELARRKLLWKFVAGLVVLACVASLVGCASQPATDHFNTDEWLAVVIGFFIGIVVAVKVVAWVAVWLARKAVKIMASWLNQAL